MTARFIQGLTKSNFVKNMKKAKSIAQQVIRPLGRNIRCCKLQTNVNCPGDIPRCFTHLYFLNPNRDDLHTCYDNMTKDHWSEGAPKSLSIFCCIDLFNLKRHKLIVNTKFQINVSSHCMIL